MAGAAKGARARPRRPHPVLGRRERARLAAAAVVAALVTAFAVLNVSDVKVNWLIATAQTPLILVIVVAFGLGVVVDRLLVVRARRRRRALP
jgi:uncharacterized integral membrane protein